MALASLEDVKRIMRIGSADVDAERDARLRAALAAVESWAETSLWYISKSGPWVEVYWDVPEDHTLYLPADDVVVTKVRVFEYPSAYGVPLSPVELGLGHGYDVTDDGKLILRPSLFVSPFEGASATRRMRQYARVEVHYEGTGVIPRAVSEGIAFLAAGYYEYGPLALKNMKSEKIGDYAYTLGGLNPEEELPYVRQANFFLKRYMRRQRVQVV